MRLIDADALKQKYTMATTRYSGGIMERPMVALEAIDEAPSIEIVRCKECKHIYTMDCAFYEVGDNVKPDDFCSYGSRSEKPNNSKERSSE